jgi:hypothetical protein
MAGGVVCRDFKLLSFGDDAEEDEAETERVSQVQCSAVQCSAVQYSAASNGTNGYGLLMNRAVLIGALRVHIEPQDQEQPCGPGRPKAEQGGGRRPAER